MKQSKTGTDHVFLQAIGARLSPGKRGLSLILGVEA
jgi:hypothetical protein